MNKTETPQQLRLAAELIETGHPFEVCRARHGEWFKPDPMIVFEWMPPEYQIRLTLATPPDGRPLHNPDGLSAEQVGIGYRLTLTDDRKLTPWMQRWSKSRQMWDVVAFVIDEDMSALESTYRLPLTAPWPEAKPDPYAELKAAHAAGKAIEVQMPNGECFDYKPGDPQWNLQPECYRIKPEPPPFQLPPPPPGTAWHREDGWKERDLPQGYRPLIYGEWRKNEDEWTHDDGNGWRRVANYGPEGEVGGGAAKHRTTRPLVFTYEGKEWTYHKPGDPMPCDGHAMVEVLYADGKQDSHGVIDAHILNWGMFFQPTCRIIGWRYAETTKQVPLGPEDVPPGSVVSGVESRWLSITCCHKDGVYLQNSEDNLNLLTWSELLRDGVKINRSIPLTGKWDANAWEPCSKEVQA